MIVAARTGPLSIWVHGLDDTGALCGAKPTGKWRQTSRLPINCPKCLYVMGKARYAVCEAPIGVGHSLLHVRLVGPEGISKAGYASTQRALCNNIVGWDIGPLEPGMIHDPKRLCHTCRVAITANAVR